MNSALKMALPAAPFIGFSGSASSSESRGVAGVDIQDVAGGLGRAVGSQKYNRLGDILGIYATLEQASFPIDRLQIRRSRLVLSGPLLSPLTLPDTRAAEHSIGIDHVDPHAEKARRDGTLVGNIEPYRTHRIVAVTKRNRRMHLVEDLTIDVGNDHACAVVEHALRASEPDTASATRDQCDASCESTGRRHTLQFRFLEQPVLDIECLLLREPAIGRRA